MLAARTNQTERAAGVGGLTSLGRSLRMASKAQRNGLFLVPLIQEAAHKGTAHPIQKGMVPPKSLLLQSLIRAPTAIRPPFNRRLVS